MRLLGLLYGEGMPSATHSPQTRTLRKVSDGTIEIYFDDMDTPVLVVEDKTFTWGQIGLGSFDDHGYWDDLKLYGRKVQRPE